VVSSLTFSYNLLSLSIFAAVEKLRMPRKGVAIIGVYCRAMEAGARQSWLAMRFIGLVAIGDSMRFANISVLLRSLCKIE